MKNGQKGELGECLRLEVLTCGSFFFGIEEVIGQVNRAGSLSRSWRSKCWLGFICLPGDGHCVLS